MQNTNALVIGASQGIGLGFVRNFLSDRTVAKVYATYRHMESAVELFNLKDHYPGKLVCLPMDITSESQIAASIERMQAEIHELHWAINCVGILHEGAMQPEKSLRQIKADQLLHYFQINSIGAVLLAKHLVPLFRRQQRSIFASLSAKVGSIGDNQLGGWYGYRASKAALNMFMRTIAIEYKRTCPKTIVVSLHPGTTDTRLSRPFQGSVPPEKLFSVERAVIQLKAVLDSLNEQDSGCFFSWDGSPLPW